MTGLDIATIAAGYLVGSLASAVLTCRVMGLPDPRSGGSGNPGATNVLRLGGKKAALITLLGDCLKGLLPVLCAGWLGRPVEVIALTGFAAFLGHLFPVFFGFKGGKGVATALGVIAGNSLAVAGMSILLWIFVALVFRFSSLAALVAAAAAPGFAAWLLPGWWQAGAIMAMAVLLFWRHHANIQRLLAGEEPRIGKKQ